MPIEKVSNILKEADLKGYAVAAFNVYNYETIEWAIEVAEEERVPIIIQFYPGLSDYIHMGTVSAITKEIAGRVSVPIGLHLDHCKTFDQAISGIRYGFRSIMIDGSTLKFEENIKLTREVVKAAHALDVDVEAELGYVGEDSKIDHFTNSENFTDPELCECFVAKTDVDSLAISIGNAHGQYVSAPNIDFKRLDEINKHVNIPLVLHGGSDIPDEQIREAIKFGINKINIATEYNCAFFQVIRNLMVQEVYKNFMYGCLDDAKNEMKNFLRSKIKLFNPSGHKV